tara:strand:+ start:1379 stop:2587 length:1209 start_codon:yes stop_codon:yes gene_type:complete
MRNFILFITLLLGYFAFGQCSDPVITNFECGDASQTVSGNGINTVVNTFQSGINKSANIGEYTDDGTNGWDNLLIDFETEIDLSSNPFLSFKLYTPTSIQVLAKLEGGSEIELWSDYSLENTWEEFNFDFSDAISNGNTKLVLFFNAAQESGTSSDIYYVDDIRFTSSTNNFPIISDFESLNSSVPLSGNIQTVSNPFYDGINTSTNVGEYIDDGTNGWDNLLIDFETEIDLSSNPFLSFKLYSPSSIQVLAKLEGGTADAEVWSDYSQENTWEEFNFDFSTSVGEGNTKLVLFFNAAQETGSSTDIYYVDDVSFVSSLSLIDEGISELIIYPNPVNNILKIISHDIINSYELFDISGRLIFTENHLNKKKFEIDISNLDSDIYILNTYSETKHESFKILKN